MPLAVASRRKLIVSDMAETLIGSEIIKLAAEVNEKIKLGKNIFNFTIGDFDPKVLPIPAHICLFTSPLRHPPALYSS